MISCESIHVKAAFALGTRKSILESVDHWRDEDFVWTSRATGQRYTATKGHILDHPDHQEHDRIKREFDRRPKERDLDSSYLAAVKRGDLEAVKRLVDDAARQAGYTVDAGHATPYSFDAFDRSKIGFSDPDTSIRGFHFSTEPDPAASYISGGFDIDRGERGATRVIHAKLRLGHAANYQTAVSLIRKQLRRWEEKNLDEWPPDDVTFPEGFDSVIFLAPWELTDAKRREYETTGKVIEGSYSMVRCVDGGVDLYYHYDGHEYDGSHISSYASLEDVYKTHTEAHYIIRDPSQIKSADPVTYDDQGEVIPLSQRFNPNSKSLRY